jgi:acyl-CoA thioesterase FadM
MKPSLRLIRVLAAPTRTRPNSAARPTADDPQAETVTQWRVLPWDIDLFGHMNNSRYALLMDFARVHYLRSVGLVAPALKERWVIPVSAVNLDFHRPLKPFEKFEIATQVLSWDDRWLFMRQTFRTRQSPSRAMATGYVKTIIRSPAGIVAPAQVAWTVCGREVEPPVLPDDVRARFSVGAQHGTGESTAQTSQPLGHSLVETLDLPFWVTDR